MSKLPHLLAPLLGALALPANTSTATTWDSVSLRVGTRLRTRSRLA